MALELQDATLVHNGETCRQNADKQQDTRSDQVVVPRPPDGGRGWIVCVAAFFSMVILDGMMFSFGVLFLELLDFFQASKSRTAMVGSALMGIHLIAGPITSAMVNTWSIRSVSIAGSLLATLSFACSIFSPNITVVTILYGIMGGIGVSMIYLPSILAVNFYFEKKRALANGITQSGSGIGTFLYSPLTEFLLGFYGWRGTMLILSGIVLNCVACSALYVPLENYRNGGRAATRGPFTKPEDEREDLLAREKRAHSHLKCLSDKVFSSSVPTLSAMSFSTPNSPPSKRVPPRGHQKGVEKYPELVDGRLASDCRAYSHGDMSPCTDQQLRYDNAWTKMPLYKKDVFYSASLVRIPEYKNGNSASLYLFPWDNPHQGAPQSRDVVSVGDKRRGFTLAFRDKLRAAKSMLHQMIGLTLLKNPKFLLCMISMVMWTTHSSVLTILPDCAVLRGVSRDNAAILLSIIGATNTAARILAGWLSDRPEVNCLYVNVCAVTLGGVCCLAIAFSWSYLLLALESAVFGLCMGTWTSLRPIILVEVTGLDNLTNAFGLVAMFQGVAFLIGPPIAGALYEYVYSYTIPFVIAGIAFTTSSALCAVLCLCTTSSCVRCGQQYPSDASHKCIVTEVE